MTRILSAYTAGLIINLRVNAILQHIAGCEFVIIGHRGAAGLAPENTLGSFRTALRWQCPMVELDVHTSIDAAGQTNLLVIHDEKLNRTTNGRGALADYTTEQLRTLDAGDAQTIPLLAEVMALLRAHQTDTGRTTALNVELKGRGTADPVAKAIADETDIPMLVSSFDHAELRRFRALDDATPVAPLYDKFSDDWSRTASELHATAVNLGAKLVTKQRVEKIRQAGFAVFVYTVNSRREAIRLKDMGVAGVFTDRPDKLMDLAGTSGAPL